jgi:hypothetical protein
MENRDKIRKQLALRPFRVFWIETVAGNQIPVERPDWFFEPPDSGGEFAVFDRTGYSLLNYRDVTSVVAVETPRKQSEQGESTTAG